MNFIFDGFATFNAIGFLIGGLIMVLIGALLLADWLGWQVRARRVRGRIVAVKSTGARRSDAEWEKEYAHKQEADAPQTSFGEEFRKNPLGGLIGCLVIGLLLLVPVVFIGFGGYMVSDYLALAAKGSQATAAVVEIDRTRDSEGAYSYVPVLRFTDAQGAEHEVRDRIGTGAAPSFGPGDRVRIFYDPAKPSRFVIESLWRYVGFGAAFMGLGFTVLAVFFGGLLFRKDKKNADEIKKEITAIKSKHVVNQHYLPVYEFTGPDGQIVSVEGRGGSNWLADKLPGRAVTLLIRPDKPDEVRQPGLLMAVLSLVFLGPGVLFLHLAVSQITWSPGGIAVMLAALGFGLWKLKGIYIPRSARPGREEYRAQRALKKAEKRKRRAENSYLMTPPEIAARVKMLDRQALVTTPLVMLFAVGLIVAGLHLGREVQGFADNGVRAEGAIAGVNGRRDSDGKTMYHAVVAFETQDGRRVRFEDKAGASAAIYETGERIAVIYDAQNPEKAMIDRGVLNWVLPGALILAGVLLGWWALRLLAGIVYRMGRR